MASVISEADPGPGPIDSFDILCCPDAFPNRGGRCHEGNSRSVQQRDSGGPLFSRIFYVFCLYSLPLSMEVEVEAEVRALESALAFWISTSHRQPSEMWGHSTLVAADNWRRDWPN